MGMTRLIPLLSALAFSRGATFPPAQRLLVDFLPSPALGVGSASPLFTFSPVAAIRNVTVATARIVVHAGSGGGGTPFWDSGDVPQSAGVDGVGVRCGVVLPEGRSFSWTVTWAAAAGGGTSAPSAPAHFATALRTDVAWRGARWVGAGHGQFRARFDLAPALAALALGGGGGGGGGGHLTALAFLASPGGAVLRLNGNTVPGGDLVGVSAWFDWTRSIPTSTHDLTPLLAANNSNELLLTIGCGNWCPSAAPTWAHSGRDVHTAAGGQPLARMLLVVTATSAAGVVREVLVLGTGATTDNTDNADTADTANNTGATAIAAPTFSSRPGPVINSSSWFGATLDHTLGAEVGWSSPPRLVPDDTLSLDLPGGGADVAPLPQPPMATFAPVTADQPVSVVPLGDFSSSSSNSSSSSSGSRGGGVFVYKMGRMVMGTVTVAAGAWGGAGRLRLEFCESLRTPSTCLRMSGYTKDGTVDVHIVDDGAAATGTTPPLAGAFSWRGFLYVIVTPEGGATFRGGLADLSAHWTGLQLEEASNISFEGVAAPMLTRLRDLVARSFRSNLVTGLPTDCPTREKHAWLGDALDVQLGAQYTYWTPSVFGAFVGQAAAGQAPNGFVPVAVPCHKGVDAAANDLSWTAGFPLGVRSLRRFYGGGAGIVGTGNISSSGSAGAVATVEVAAGGYFAGASWSALRSWTDAQLTNATAQARPGGLPDYWQFGDESAIARTKPYAGDVARRCAAACFLVALDAMAELAAARGEADDAARWNAALTALRGQFDTLFWQSNGTAAGLSSYSAEADARQTIDGMALAAGVGSAAHRTAAAATLLADVTARNFTLTVGSVGQKRLLTTLSSLGGASGGGGDELSHSAADAGAGHDAALRVALGSAFPSWGWWLSQGATTCWESWTSMDKPGDDHLHGSRNHAWLCGGLAEWLHADLGGIAPIADGFGTVSIAPKISATLGPSGVAMTLQTVRGPVSCNWTRGDAALRRWRQLWVEGDGGGGIVLASDALLPMQLLRLHVALPPGVSGDVVLPLLGAATAEQLRRVIVTEGTKLLWGGNRTVVDGAAEAAHSVEGVRLVGLQRGSAPGAGSQLRLSIGSGSYEFSVQYSII